MHKSVRNFYILCVSTPLMFIFIWLFAIDNTIDQYSDLRMVNNELEKLDQAPFQLAAMEKRLGKITGAIGNSSQNMGGDEIFGRISEYVVREKTLQIMNFPMNNNFENSNYEIHTYTIKMTGKYKDLLKMLNYFETNKNIGKIVSVDFKVEKNLKTKKKFLIMMMYVQTYNRLT